MKTEACKFPMQEDYRCFISNGRPETPSNNHKLITIAGFLLLITTSLLIGFTFYSFIQIKELREQIEVLQNSLKELRSSVNEVQYDDLYTEDPDLVENHTETITLPKSDDYDNYYDYDDSYDDDQSEEDEENEIVLSVNKILTGDQFTKDFKETKNTRTKRNVIGYTNDGVPINSEPFSEVVRRNKTLKQPSTSEPYQSPYPYTLTPGMRLHQESWRTTSTPRPVYSRRSRVFHPDDPSKAFRRVVKKSSLLKSGDQHTNSEEDSDVEFTIVRNEQVGGGSRVRHRGRHLETLDERHPVRTGRMRPLPTAHFSGDTSKYILGQHDNFKGNGHLSHPHKTYVDWMESSWFHSLGMDRHFSLVDGHLTIKESGLYFIYAQIYYYDEHDTNGFRVYKNGDPLLQCTIMIHSENKVMKGNTCFTAGADYLQEGERLSLGDLGNSRFSIFEPGKSFFGVIKLGDVKIK